MKGDSNVRVFLLTHRRPKLLRRALKSLLCQTYAHWTCELHNDAPDDTEPEAILSEVAPGDPRIVYRPHESNRGPVRSFNQVFLGGHEPYAALLEDDNWWEPRFLERLLLVIEQFPDASLVWSNMRMWKEAADGGWADTGETIWKQSAQQEPAVFHPPELLQAFEALHSNGAMIFRPAAFQVRTVPAEAPFAIIEALRERVATGRLVYCPEVLANFAITRESARRRDPADWVQAQLLLSASYFQCMRPDRWSLQRTWDGFRAMRPVGTDIFFLTALVLGAPWLLVPARPQEYIRMVLVLIRHPRRAYALFRFRRVHASTWRWLCEASRRWKGCPACTITNKRSFPENVSLTT